MVNSDMKEIDIVDPKPLGSLLLENWHFSMETEVSPPSYSIPIIEEKRESWLEKCLCSSTLLVLYLKILLEN